MKTVTYVTVFLYKKLTALEKIFLRQLYKAYINYLAKTNIYNSLI